MRCQVSNKVSELLEGAAAEPGTRILLVPRGRVSIKGKGEMETSWLMSAQGDERDSITAVELMKPQPSVEVFSL